MRPSIHVLPDELIPQILQEAKRILAEIGVDVRGAGLRQRLLDMGLKAEERDGRILFPPHIVDQAIASTPHTFTLYDRDGRPHAHLGGDSVHFVPGSSGLKVLDYKSGQTRLANTADFVEYVRLCDGLEHIAYLATAFSTNDDIEAQVSDAWRLYLCLSNSRKPVVSGAFTEHGVPRMAEMMQLFRQDKADLIARPLSIFTITATGFFRYGEDSCQNLLDCVEWGIPIEIVPVTLMGLIAPVTLVGATVFHVADVLAGLTMAQIVKPGAPVLFGGAPAAFHMQTAVAPMAAIEALKLNVAYVQVAKSLNLPTQAYMALSEGKFVDAQAGAETFGSALLAALAGINSISGPGMLDYVLTFSLEKLVADNEWCGQALHFVRQAQVIDDLPTFDLARELLAEQHLITAEHTLAHWPQELYLTKPTTDRTNRETWQKLGGHTFEQRAKLEVMERLAKYEPVETDTAVLAEMQRLIKSGLVNQVELPEVVAAVRPSATSSAPTRRP
ncbi:MAG TPA: trimethylamine methyltransferase family protein, partial [Chloroflexota bacterium]|nr:trimethylamine methyltransferase family protein [Chloroflexota bacterium]